MSVCILLTSTPLHEPKVREQLAPHFPVEVLSIAAVPFDKQERDGLAELMREVRAEHGLCLVDPAATIYERGVFDAPSASRTHLLEAAARASLAHAEQATIVIMLEWDGFDATVAFSGNLVDFSALIAMDGSWPVFRYLGMRSELQEDPYRTMVFKLSR